MHKNTFIQNVQSCLPYKGFPQVLEIYINIQRGRME